MTKGRANADAAGTAQILNLPLGMADDSLLCLGQSGRSRSGQQYWRVENLKSFDEFLERRFPESRRKAYYLM